MNRVEWEAELLVRQTLVEEAHDAKTTAKRLLEEAEEEYDDASCEASEADDNLGEWEAREEEVDEPDEAADLEDYGVLRVEEEE